MKILLFSHVPSRESWELKFHDFANPWKINSSIISCKHFNPYGFFVIFESKSKWFWTKDSVTV